MLSGKITFKIDPFGQYHKITAFLFDPFQGYQDYDITDTLCVFIDSFIVFFALVAGPFCG